MFQFPVKIYYEDTDAGGIVYHANYLKFCERARTELLLSLGIEQDRYLKQNIGFVVTRMDIVFKTTAKLHEELNVWTQIKKIKKVSIEFEQIIKNTQQDTVFSAKVVVACINPNSGKPSAIPAEILGELQRAS